MPSPCSPTTPVAARRRASSPRGWPATPRRCSTLESNVARVIDPAGGSWYVERLTDELAERAWTSSRRSRPAGGFRAAVEAGHRRRRIAAVRRPGDADRPPANPDHRASAPSPSERTTSPRARRRPRRRRHRWAAASRHCGCGSTAPRRPATGRRCSSPPRHSGQHRPAGDRRRQLLRHRRPRPPQTGSTDIDDVVTAFAASGASVACVSRATTSTARRDECRRPRCGGSDRALGRRPRRRRRAAALADLLDHLRLR